MKCSLRSCSALYKAVPLLVVGGVFSVVSAHAQLTDHYSFNDGTATDSVNAANSGTVSGTVTFSSGMLTTAGSGYVALPTTVGAGTTGDFSIETFTKTTAFSNFTAAFSLATGTGMNANPSTNFILLNASRQNAGGNTTADFRQDATTGTTNETDVSAGSSLLSDGAVHDILITYVSATGAVSIYNNGTLAGTGNIGAGFSLASAAKGGDNGINGGSPFDTTHGGNDPDYTGSTDDFRLYSNALTAAQAASVDALGVNATDAQIGAITGVVPEPSTWMAALVGLGALVGVRRFRRSMV